MGARNANNNTSIRHLMSLVAGTAVAQEINLSGRYLCVNCPPGQAKMGYMSATGWNCESRERNRSGLGEVTSIVSQPRFGLPIGTRTPSFLPDGITARFNQGLVWNGLLICAKVLPELNRIAKALNAAATARETAAGFVGVRREKPPAERKVWQKASRRAGKVEADCLFGPWKRGAWANLCSREIIPFPRVSKAHSVRVAKRPTRSAKGENHGAVLAEPAGKGSRR